MNGDAASQPAGGSAPQAPRSNTPSAAGPSSNAPAASGPGPTSPGASATSGAPATSGAADASAPANAPRAAPGAAPSLASRLRDVRVGLRADLETTRHVFRGEIAYLLRDPLTLDSHRFGVREYSIAVRLSDERTLRSVFDELVLDHTLAREDEEEFYGFVFSLHRLGFLALPLDDEKLLYRRAQARAKAKRGTLLGAFFWYPLPLWNPDRFLERTLPLVRPFLTQTAFAAWTCVVGAALWIVAHNWDEFRAPLANIFAGENLPLLWCSLIVLKLFHEFGHAYTCKLFGGIVPEMGVNLVFFTPTAYVDATSCWTFTSRWKRLWVCLAGMYVELFLASLAVFVWSVTSPGLVHSLSHDVVLLASIVTIAFNLNPLMRYDGYHALCDLLEVPNLRARSVALANGVLQRVLLGLPIADVPKEKRLAVLFVAFGTGCALYRVVLVIAICTAISLRYFDLGIALAAAYGGTELWRLGKRVLPWLWSAKETALVRSRAVALSLFLFALLPAALLALPLPPRAIVPGVVSRDVERSVCVESGGVLEELHARDGDHVSANAPLARLADPELPALVRASRARVAQAELALEAERLADPNRARAAEQRLDSARAELADVERKERELSVLAPFDGELVHGLRDADLGRYLPRGAELGWLAGGPLSVRALCSQEEWTGSLPKVGDAVEFRSRASPEQVLRGHVARVVPAGARELAPSLAALTQLSGGSIAIDPLHKSASRAHFEIVAALDDAPADGLRLGTTGLLRLEAPMERLGSFALRKWILFTQRLRGAS